MVRYIEQLFETFFVNQACGLASNYKREFLKVLLVDGFQPPTYRLEGSCYISRFC